MRLLAVVALGGALAACGSSATTQRDFTEHDVLAALHLQTANRGATYHNTHGCTVNQILNTPEEVDLYRSAGDTVVSDKTSTIGVKAVGASHTCQTLFRRDLNRLAG